MAILDYRCADHPSQQSKLSTNCPRRNKFILWIIVQPVSGSIVSGQTSYLFKVAPTVSPQRPCYLQTAEKRSCNSTAALNAVKAVKTGSEKQRPWTPESRIFIRQRNHIN